MPLRRLFEMMEKMTNRAGDGRCGCLLLGRFGLLLHRTVCVLTQSEGSQEWCAAKPAASTLIVSGLWSKTMQHFEGSLQPYNR